MNAYKNEFSWSFSRETVFQKCRRMYYLHYYGSWNGWSENADARTRLTYILKQLKTRQMWVGTKVHESIARVIEEIREGRDGIEPQKHVDEAIDSMRRDFRSSQRKMYRLEPKTCALYEHEYELDIPDAEWKAAADHAAQCLETFFRSDIFNSLFELSQDQWLAVEKFSSFLLDDVRIFVIPDLAVRQGGDVLIYDWKTGKGESGSSPLQLAAYGLFAAQRWDASPDRIRTVEFSLAGGDRNEGRMTAESIAETEAHIKSSIEEMTNLLEDVPSNSALEERFPLAENETACGACNFRKVCPRWS